MPIKKIAGRNYFVDHKENRIEFLDSRFYKCADGSFVPSVTTLLEAYPKGAGFYEWLKKSGENAEAIRDAAGRSGTAVHDATEVLDHGGKVDLCDANGEPTYKLKEWAMIDKYREFRERFDVDIHAIETKLADAGLGYAGTLDRVATIDGVTRIIDIKTSGGIWPSYWLQQAAYHKLLLAAPGVEKMFPGGKVPEIKLSILWLNSAHRGNGKKGDIQGVGWKLIDQPETTEHYFDLFTKTRGLWLAEHKDEQPKSISHSLSISLNTKKEDEAQRSSG